MCYLSKKTKLAHCSARDAKLRIHPGCRGEWELISSTPAAPAARRRWSPSSPQQLKRLRHRAHPGGGPHIGGAQACGPTPRPVQRRRCRCRPPGSAAGPPAPPGPGPGLEPQQRQLSRRGPGRPPAGSPPQAARAPPTQPPRPPGFPTRPRAPSPRPRLHRACAEGQVLRARSPGRAGFYSRQVC